MSQSSFLSPEENRWCTHFSLDYLQMSLAASLSCAVHKLLYDQQKAAFQGSRCIWQEHLTVWDAATVRKKPCLSAAQFLGVNLLK